MRVVHVVASLDDRAGGLTGAVVSIANAGARQGLEVAVAATTAVTSGTGDEDDAGTARADLDPRVQVHLFPRSRVAGRFAGSPGLRRWLRAHVDATTVVHAHAVWDLASRAGLRAARRGGAALLLSPHGSLDPFDLRKHRLAKRLLGPSALRPALAPATVLCTTHEEARRLVTYGAGPAVDVLPLPPGRVEQPATGRTAFRTRYAVAPDARVVLFLGRISYKKGIAHLLRALARLEPDVVLVVVGAGEPAYEQAMRALATDLHLDDRVVWVGWLRGPDKAAAYAAADVFVLLSDTENYGIAVVEALQHGLVAVTSDQVGSGVDLAAEDAVLLSPREPVGAARVIGSALDDADLRARTRAAAAAVLAGRLDPGRVDDDYGTLLRTLGAPA